MAVNTEGPVELAENIYWVGVYDPSQFIQCHSYLVVDGDEAVLIDPGSVVYFEQTYEKIVKIVPVEKIRYIVVGHQDPDVCASIPLFEREGFAGEVVTHWRTSVLLPSYGIESKYYLVDQNQYRLRLTSGRTLEFIHTPYLHFPGSVMAYDPESKILFSNDLFGAFSYNWSFWADDRYIEAMEAFHEHYMPGHEILGPVMELLLNLEISMIAPQHGSLIREQIKDSILALRDLECGAFLRPIKKELVDTGGYTGLCNRFLKRYYSLFDPAEVRGIFADSEITIDEKSSLIGDFKSTGHDLWDGFFDLIYSKKGIIWLTVVEPLVMRISKEYDVDLPKVYGSSLMEAERKFLQLEDENIQLRELNERLEKNLQETEDSLNRDPRTHLYNQAFFIEYLKTDVSIALEKGTDTALVVVEIDHLPEIVLTYGEEVWEEMLRNATYLLNENKDDLSLLFSIEGDARFAIYMPGADLETAVEFAEKLRTTFSDSEIFIQKTTVSIGVASLAEFRDSLLDGAELALSFALVARQRMLAAKNRGMNNVCWESDIDADTVPVGKILIVEPDELNANIIETSLKTSKLDVSICRDGIEALEVIEKTNPDLIISEIFLPKMDGFRIRENMLQSSILKDIPFIILSHKKDEETVQRALSLDIVHYIKKPYMLSELVGIVRKSLPQGSL